MKATLVLAVAILVGLVLIVGAPLSSAQDDSGSGDTPPSGCVSTGDGSDGGGSACVTTQGADGSGSVDMSSDSGSPTGADEPTPGDAPTPVPTDTPMPVATDTPTPVAVPTDTPMPVATATPMPVPTDTPVPAPTSTPPAATPTSSSHDVPPGTLAQQLPFQNPGDSSCTILLDVSAQNPCDAQTFPAVFNIQFSPWANNIPISVQVDGHTPQTTSKMSWDVLSVPGGLPPGTHHFSASEKVGGKTSSASLQLKVLKATSPHLLVYPRTVPPGSKAQVWLAGFPANTSVPLGIYRERDTCNAFPQRNQCYQLAHDLGSVTTDNDGTASTTFSISTDERKTGYMVASPGLHIDPEDTADSLITLGKPWFIVDLPPS